MRPLRSRSGRAAIGAGEGAGTQILDNVMHGRHWSDDVGSAAIFGAATGGRVCYTEGAETADHWPP